MGRQRRTHVSVERLAAQAAEAAQLRALQTDPDVVALRVERVRRAVSILVWIGMGLGMAFTATQVQAFAAADSDPYSVRWWAAWVLDPMVSLILLAVLWAEQETSRYRVPTGPWTRRLKWVALAAVYAMNTWAAWAALDPAQIVLHSVPPLVVLLAAEAGPELRHRLTDAVYAAHAEAASVRARTNGSASVDTASAPSTDTASGQSANGSRTPVADTEGQSTRTAARRRPASTDAGRAPSTEAAFAKRRVTADEYADTAVAAWTPGTDVTAAWIQQVTGCTRSTAYKVLPSVRARTGGSVSVDTANGQSTDATVRPSTDEYADTAVAA